ncbi:MAG: glutathione S-transferase family protein [Burkholderiales bacterium]|nr:glutathione S-transferase family protein [Burkholderiales bacterium]
MKLYDFELAPNPRRVRIFLAEKKVTVPMVQVNTRNREQFSEEFKAINPFSLLPVLELDDGKFIGESTAICRYFELLYPDPVLMGRDATEQAIVEMWDRRAELEGMSAVGEIVRNALPMFEGRGVAGVPDGFPQIPALVQRGKKRMIRFFDFWNRQLSANQFVAGPNFSIADITSFVAIEFAKRAEVTIPENYQHVARWYEEVSSRDSTKS